MLALAAAVERLFRSSALGECLHQRYTNEPDIRDECLNGAVRLRFIFNVLTRLRFCDV